MAIPTDLKTTIEQNLLDLISAEVREGKAIEYKREINVATPDQKQKFVRTIASFANASGGEIVYGMDATDGKPAKLQPLSDFDPDKNVLQLRDILRAHVDPLLFGVEFQPVPTQGGWALVIRVPRSWNPPHMVKLDDNRFWTRNEGGRVLMAVPEIRESVLVTKNLKERIREYRFSRLNSIRSGELPFKLAPRALAVFHVLPFRSFMEDSEVDLNSLKDGDLHPPSEWRNCGPRYDLDGVYGSETEQDGTCGNYIFVSRTGCIEALTVHYLPAHRGKFISNPDLEGQFIRLLPRCVQMLRRLNAELPVVLALSLLDIADYILYSGFQRSLGVMGVRPLKQRDLILPPAIMTTFDEPAPKVLKPIYDALWRSCGLQHCFNYDQNGNWNGKPWD